MTEIDWLSSFNLMQMCDFAWSKASKRKWRLFSCACCRRIWDILGDHRSRAAVEMAERYADGLVTDSELANVLHSASVVGDNAASFLASEEPWLIAWRAAFDVGFVAADGSLKHKEAVAQCDLLRDIIGNPFHSYAIESTWICLPVQQTAIHIYESNQFQLLPKLAAALEEAGCKNQEILQHCRSINEHARGCWVLDLVLGKV